MFYTSLAVALKVKITHSNTIFSTISVSLIAYVNELKLKKRPSLKMSVRSHQLLLLTTSVADLKYSVIIISAEPEFDGLQLKLVKWLRECNSCF